MEQVRVHPDISDPYRPGRGDFGENRPFIKDLELAVLLESVPFYSEKTRKPAMDMLADKGSDMDTEIIRNEEGHHYG